MSSSHPTKNYLKQIFLAWCVNVLPREIACVRVRKRACVCVCEREDRSSCLFCYVFGHVYHDYSMQLLMQQTPVDEKFPQSCCSGFFRANRGSCSLNSGPKSCPCCHGKNFYGILRRKTTRLLTRCFYATVWVNYRIAGRCWPC